MKTRTPSPHSLERLRDLTPARVGLGLAGASLPTKALLEFTLDHARARDAVHATFDVAAMMRGLGELGLEASTTRTPLHSCAASFHSWPPGKSKSAMPWLHRERGSRWAMRSAPFSARAWWSF